MAHITLLAYPNCAMSGISGIIDTLAMANLWADDFREGPPLFTWDIVSPDGKPVLGNNRIHIRPHGALSDVRATDFIVIPGFQPPFEFMGKVPEPVKDFLRRCHRNRTLIGTICTGTFFLAETGLLDGRVATTNRAFAGYFRRCYPAVRLKAAQILTHDAGLVCSGATTAFLDLCLYMIERFGSSDLADRCARSMLAERNRTHKSPYSVCDFQKNHLDDKVLKAQGYMEDHFTRTVSIEGLAKELGLSSRHFKRRFKNATGESPLSYLQQVRIEAAKQRLAATGESVEEITIAVGYQDSNSFRRLFKKNTGLSPRAYRDRFARVSGV